MSQKKNDQKFISDLLGKLKASYSEPEEPIDSSVLTPKEANDDAEFQKQLLEILTRANQEEAATPAPKSKAKKADTNEEPVEVTKAQKAPKAPSTPKKKTTKKRETPKKETSASKAKEEAPSKDLLTKEPSIQIEAPESIATIELAEPIKPAKQSPPAEPSKPADKPITEALKTQEEPKQATSATPQVSTPPKEPISKAQTEENIRIIPKEPTSASQPKSSSDSIVIRPKGARSNQTPIVIRPRVSTQNTPEPQIVAEEAPKSTIKIGKEATASMKTPTPLREKPATAKKAEKKPQVGIRIPRPSEIASGLFGIEKKAPTASTAKAKRNPRKAVNRTGLHSKKKLPTPTEPITPAPIENEQLDEALEQVFSDAAYSEPAPVAEPISKEKTQPTFTNAHHAEKTSSLPLTAEQIRKKAGLSEDDLTMLFELGYENELANLVGPENLKTLKSDHLKKERKNEGAEYPAAFGYRGKEYVEESSQGAILAAYARDRKHLIIRSALTAFLTLLLLFTEIPALLGTYYQTITDLSPLILPILSILLLAGATAFAFQQTRAGLKDLFHFAPSPYSVCSILLILVGIYDIIGFFMPQRLLPANFLAALVILITMLCDVFRVINEVRTFRLVSEKGEKTVLEPFSPRRKKMKQGDRIVKILNDDVDKQFYRVAKAKNTTGFFRRVNTMRGAILPFSYLLFAELLMAFLLAFVIAIQTLSFSAALSSFVKVLFLGAPLSVVLGFFYPLMQANRLLAKQRCALIGDEAIDEYAQHKTVIFEDQDMFHTEKCTEIAIRETDDFQNDMKLASALFRKIGNTLEPIGKAGAAQDLEIPISLVRITENGTEATSANHHLIAGNAEFLKKCGIHIPKESADRALRRTENVSMMYVAIDGVLKLSYEIEYTAKPTFEQMIEELADSNTSVALFSYDPNLNNNFVQTMRQNKSEAVHIIKPSRYEENSTLELVDTGAISLEDPQKIVYPLHAAAKISKLRLFTIRMQLIAILLGGISVLLLSLLGQSDLLGIVQILLYQLFWSAVTLIAIHTELRESKLHLLK